MLGAMTLSVVEYLGIINFTSPSQFPPVWCNRMAGVGYFPFATWKARVAGLGYLPAPRWVRL